MKTLILSVLTLAFSVPAIAQDSKAPEFYSANFEIESVIPLCPIYPGGYSCSAIGNKVTIVATLGCVDTLLFSEIEHRFTAAAIPDIYVVSVVKRHPNADRIRCYKAHTVKKTFVVPYDSMKLNLINASIEAQF